MPTLPSHHEEHSYEEHSRQRAQALLLLRQFNGTPDEPGPVPVDTGPRPMKDGQATWPIRYLYAKHHILVRAEHLDAVREILTEIARRQQVEVREGEGRQWQPIVTPIGRRVRKLSLPEGMDVLDALEWVHRGTETTEGLGTGAARPDHVISITPAGWCPAREPDPVPTGTERDPGPTTNRHAGRGVRVVVVDTGLDPLAPSTHPWMSGVTGQPDPGIGATLQPYAGHGTFIAGVIRTMAPEAEVHVVAPFSTAGAVLESELAPALEDVVTTYHPDIISMSAGATTNDGTCPLALEQFYENLLRHHKGVVLVAAAGNDGDRVPFWPAAAPWAVSVGALNLGWDARASFSNFGGWVDCYAPGDNLINAYPSGTYTYTEPPHPVPPAAPDTATFTGMASWSGTSFATPVVAGLVAARMTETGENGVQAAAALLAAAPALPGVGRVLLPG
jgi:hypothetical protein